MAETVSVAFPREIDPLRMTEFVAHEIEIPTAVQGKSRKTRHFMQRHATFNGKVLLVVSHTAVYILVGKLKEERFAAD